MMMVVVCFLFFFFFFFFFFLNKNTLPLLRWCKVKIISRLVELFDWSRFLFFCYFIFLCIFDGRFLIVRPSVSIYHWPFRNAPSFPFFFFFLLFRLFKKMTVNLNAARPPSNCLEPTTTTKSTLSKTLFFFFFHFNIFLLLHFHFLSLTKK